MTEPDIPLLIWLFVESIHIEYLKGQHTTNIIHNNKKTRGNYFFYPVLVQSIPQTDQSDNHKYQFIQLLIFIYPMIYYISAISAGFPVVIKSTMPSAHRTLCMIFKGQSIPLTRLFIGNILVESPAFPIFRYTVLSNPMPLFLKSRDQPFFRYLAYRSEDGHVYTIATIR